MKSGENDLSIASFRLGLPWFEGAWIIFSRLSAKVLKLLNERRYDTSDNLISQLLNDDKSSPLIFHLSSNISSSFTYAFAFFTFHGYSANSQTDQLPVGLIAQSVEHCTGVAEIMGSNPVRPEIFQTSISQLLTAMIIHKFISFYVVQIYDLWYIYLHPSPSTGIL